MTEQLYIPIESFESTGLVKAGISQRIGGVSPPPYESLNLATHVSDRRENVTSNQQKLSEQIGIKTLKYCRQIHSDKVIDADQITHSFWNGIGSEDSSPTGDALISKIHNTTLGVFTADCVPISILDVNTPSIGIVHAGWRGTFSQIVIKTLDKMKDDYGTNPVNCLINFGPSIQKCCYEVGSDLLTQFSNKFGDSVVNGNHLCLQTANVNQLIDYSVPDTSISISPVCTACNLNRFYSYRVEGEKTGRMLSYIQLI
ncbi:peptidoglycan editing factor PgeF [Candidatus Poribacteria bacterium]|nr:MAG: peptidoglycan editing factor PgeF [Candidatus Poribacteria bacterium]